MVLFKLEYISTLRWISSPFIIPGNTSPQTFIHYLLDNGIALVLSKYSFQRNQFSHAHYQYNFRHLRFIIKFIILLLHKLVLLDFTKRNNISEVGVKLSFSTEIMTNKYFRLPEGQNKTFQLSNFYKFLNFLSRYLFVIREESESQTASRPLTSLVLIHYFSVFQTGPSLFYCN